MSFVASVETDDGSANESEKNEASETVAVFGGSFNPPHVAHQLACVLARSTRGADRVLVVPTYQHPFAKTLAPYDDRLAMCEACMGHLPGVGISRVEAELGGESRTLRTLEHLTKVMPKARLRLLVGADILLEANKWHGWDRIVELAPPMVLGRVGVSHPDAPLPVLPDVSSTRVRRALASRGDDSAELRDLVPSAVLAYARARDLYR
jgi:nicotinate-nucleotide adenylyltransferase